MIRIEANLLDIISIDIKKQSYELDIYLTFSSSQKIPHVQIELINGVIHYTEKRIDEPRLQSYRMFATLHKDFDFRQFPFLREHLTLQMEDRIKTIKEVVFATSQNEVKVGPNAAIAGWNINEVSAKVENRPSLISGKITSQYALDIDASRQLAVTFGVMLLPIVIMVVFMILFLRRLSRIEEAVLLFLSLLFSSAVYHVSVLSSLPSLSYLTYFDKFMLVNYATIIIGIIYSLGTSQILILLQEIARIDQEHIIETLKADIRRRIGLWVSWLMIHILLAYLTFI